MISLLINKSPYVIGLVVVVAIFSVYIYQSAKITELEQSVKNCNKNLKVSEDSVSSLTSELSESDRLLSDAKEYCLERIRLCEDDKKNIKDINKTISGMRSDMKKIKTEKNKGCVKHIYECPSFKNFKKTWNSVLEVDR